ncbi:MAG: hypothetical protein MN733_27875 [Nitrososphaera sp.]|nr:hypothetical protein [Nitrososphaera sp.]
MRLIKWVLVFLLSVSLLGCGWRVFSPRETNPVLEDYVATWFNREVGTLATDAAHRITVIRMAEGQGPDKWQRGEFCAEPPPDAMVNIAGAFGAALAARIKLPDQTGGATAIAEGSGETEFYRTIATVMSPLLRRSQGLQWSRDNLSFVCNAYLNRVIDKIQYKDLVDEIILQSKGMIEKELHTLPRFDVKIVTSGGAQAPKAETLLRDFKDYCECRCTADSGKFADIPEEKPDGRCADLNKQECTLKVEGENGTVTRLGGTLSLCGSY